MCISYITHNVHACTDVNAADGAAAGRQRQRAGAGGAGGAGAAQP